MTINWAINFPKFQNVPKILFLPTSSSNSTYQPGGKDPPERSKSDLWPASIPANNFRVGFRQTWPRQKKNAGKSSVVSSPAGRPKLRDLSAFWMKEFWFFSPAELANWFQSVWQKSTCTTLWWRALKPPPLDVFPKKFFLASRKSSPNECCWTMDLYFSSRTRGKWEKNWPNSSEWQWGHEFIVRDKNSHDLWCFCLNFGGKLFRSALLVFFVLSRGGFPTLVTIFLVFFFSSELSCPQQFVELENLIHNETLNLKKNWD